MPPLDLVIIVRVVVNEVVEDKRKILLAKTRNMIVRDSYIGRSGQSWKIWLFVLLLTVGAVAMLFGFLPPINADPSLFVPFVLGGAFLALGSLVWLSLSVKCRACGRRFGWRVMREQPYDRWFALIMTTRECPICRDDPSTEIPALKKRG